MKLYDISKEFIELQNMDLPVEVINDTLQGIKLDLKEKAQNISHLISSWNSDIDAINNEVKRLNAMKKARSNKINAIKEYLAHNMESMGIDKIECDLFTITLRKAGADVVVIDDENALLGDYKIIKETPNKTAIKQALNSGYTVKGAHLEPAKRGLVIK